MRIFEDAMMDQISDPIFCYNRDKRYVFANRAAQSYTGLSFDEMKMKTDLELFGDEAIKLDQELDKIIQARSSGVRNFQVSFNGLVSHFNSSFRSFEFENSEYLLVICRNAEVIRHELAHQINNPLEVINASVSILKAKLKKGDELPLHLFDRIQNTVQMIGRSLTDISHKKINETEPIEGLAKGVKR